MKNCSFLQARELETPDVTERKKKVEEMECGNFEWYMKNVSPDTHIVAYKDIISHGEVISYFKFNYFLA